MLQNFLPKDYNLYLKTGKWYKNTHRNKNGWPRKDRIEYTIIYQLISYGITKKEIEDNLKNLENSFYNKHPKWFEKAYYKASLYYKKHKKYDFDIIADGIIEKCKYLPLQPSLRVMLEEIIKICKKVHSFNNIAIPMKNLSLRLKQTYHTTYTQFKKLMNIKMKPIEQTVKPKWHITCGYYTIHAEELNRRIQQLENKEYIHKTEYRTFIKTSSVCNEEFRVNKLGKTGKIIYDFLLENKGKSFKRKEIEKILKINIQTVIKKLEMLVTKNFIQKSKEKNTRKPFFIYFIE